MQNTLINDIDNYISYLNSKGLSVSVHGKLINGLIKHNLHKNPYCIFFKAYDDTLSQCLKCQQKVFNAHNNDYIFGMCWAGVEEYVFYIDSKTFISVSGYGIEKEKAMERINFLSHRFYLNKSALLTIYDQGLKHEKENFDELKTLIKPLCHMLSLLKISIGEISQSESENKIFDSILKYVQANITQKISLRSIADACSCSESTVSHLFKKYTNQAVKKYINNLRVKRAENLLVTSNLPIGKIAPLCGFENTNYFSTAFKKQTGKNPTEYRLQKIEK